MFAEAKKYFNSKIDLRVKEIKKTIDMILDVNFLKKKLFRNAKAQLEKENLIVSGHNLGGTAALKAADSDSRIKLLLLQDPLIDPVASKLDTFENASCKRVQIITTMQHYLDNLADGVIEDQFKPMFENEKKFEMLLVDKTDALHMTDLNIILPLETESIIKRHYSLEGKKNY